MCSGETPGLPPRRCRSPGGCGRGPPLRLRGGFCECCLLVDDGADRVGRCVQCRIVGLDVERGCVGLQRLEVGRYDRAHGIEEVDALPSGFVEADEALDLRGEVGIPRRARRLGPLGHRQRAVAGLSRRGGRRLDRRRCVGGCWCRDCRSPRVDRRAQRLLRSPCRRRPPRRHRNHRRSLRTQQRAQGTSLRRRRLATGD